MERSQGGYPPPSYRNAIESDGERRLRTLTHVLYALYAVHYFTGGISVLIAIIVGYVKRPDTIGTLYEAHFNWQIRTFWWALFGYFLGGMMALSGYLMGDAVFFMFPLGILLVWAVGIWTLYRIIKGWLYLYDSKPLRNPRALF